MNVNRSKNLRTEESVTADMMLQLISAAAHVAVTEIEARPGLACFNDWPWNLVCDLIKLDTSLGYDLQHLRNVRQLLKTFRFGFAGARPATYPVLMQSMSESAEEIAAHAHYAPACSYYSKDNDQRTGGELAKTSGYSLKSVTDLVFDPMDAKVADEWRLRYGELCGDLIAEWSQLVGDYLADDAQSTLDYAAALQLAVADKQCTTNKQGQDQS